MESQFLSSINHLSLGLYLDAKGPFGKNEIKNTNP